MGSMHVTLILSPHQGAVRCGRKQGAPGPYRETIRKTAEAQGKHKKQTGGHGQYGDVRIRYTPLERGEVRL